MQTAQKHILLRIGGMSCINCQNRIEQALLRTGGILRAQVRYDTGEARIDYDERRITPERIAGIIRSLGYTVPADSETGSTLKTAATLAVIVCLYALLQATGVLNRLAPDRLAESGMSYGMLFVIGLITSVHCVAMCGGINLSQSLPAGGAQGQPARRPALAYNLGRVVSYTAVGLVLGLIGRVIGGDGGIGMSSLLQGILKMAAGVLMIVMGMGMLGLFPGLRRFTPRLPAGLARRIRAKTGAPGRPFLVGVLNGFMPCGPLQSMWIVALASGSPLAGALSMLAFSLGTVPLMLGLGAAVSALGRRFTSQVMRVGAVLVVVLGLSMLAQGGALSGWLPAGLLMALLIALCAGGVLLSLPVRRRAARAALRCAGAALVAGAVFVWFGLIAPNAAAPGGEALVGDGVQLVSSTLSPGRYPSITVQAGTPVRWVIDAPEGSINGCNYRIVIPDYGIEYTFRTGENVIEFTPEQEGTHLYSCWMGMIRGVISVVGAQEDMSEAAPVEEIVYPIGGSCCF